VIFSGHQAINHKQADQSVTRCKAFQSYLEVAQLDLNMNISVLYVDLNLPDPKFEKFERAISHYFFVQKLSEM
jgi:DNA-directed RNA polymerase delta subunit